MVETGWISGLAVLVAAVGAHRDARTGFIPNWLTLPSLAAGPLLWLGTAGLHAAGVSLLGALVCALGPAVVFWRGGLGGGDVKLFAALGAFTGPSLGLDLQFLAFLCAALYVPARIAWNGHLLRVLGRLLRRSSPPELLGSLRLGPAIFAGTLIAVLHRSVLG